MTTLATAFDDDVEDRGRGGFRRDGRGNPIIKHMGHHLTYTSMSSLPNYIENLFGLHRWEKRLTARAIAEQEDVAALVSSMRWTGDRDKDRASNKELDRILDLALEKIGVHEKANLGTAYHSYTDPATEGERGYVRQQFRSTVEAYDAAADRWGLTIRRVEQAVVTHELAGAGTFDYEAQLEARPDLGWLMTDKKSGKLHAGPFAVQTSGYAHGVYYDTVNEVDMEMSADHVNPRWGLIIHGPQGEGTCEYFLVDLEQGWRAAKLARDVRLWQTESAKSLLTPLQELKIPDLVAVTTNVESLRVLYRRLSEDDRRKHANAFREKIENEGWA